LVATIERARIVDFFRGRLVGANPAEGRQQQEQAYQEGERREGTQERRGKVLLLKADEVADRDDPDRSVNRLGGVEEADRPGATDRDNQRQWKQAAQPGLALPLSIGHFQALQDPVGEWPIGNHGSVSHS
jgi:hypothetical protein